MTVVNALITPQYHGLIRIECRNPRKCGQKLVRGHAPAVHDEATIGLHVDDHLSDGATLFLGLARRGHLYIEFSLLPCKTPREHEEAEQYEENIDHRGNQKSPWLGL